MQRTLPRATQHDLLCSTRTEQRQVELHESGVVRDRDRVGVLQKLDERHVEVTVADDAHQHVM